MRDEFYGDGDLFTIQEFLEMVEERILIDYDGFGYPVKDGLTNPNIEIYPSDIQNIPEGTTHIRWYNK